MGTTINFLRRAASIGLGATARYPRRTTSATADNGLGTTTKYLPGATGIGLGTKV
jgi:hypothetical protein